MSFEIHNIRSFVLKPEIVIFDVPPLNSPSKALQKTIEVFKHFAGAYGSICNVLTLRPTLLFYVVIKTLLIGTLLN